MFHGGQSEPVFLHTSQDTRATHTQTHTPNRIDEAAEMASTEQSDEKLEFSDVPQPLQPSKLKSRPHPQ